MKTQKETTNRYPAWWLLYYIIRGGYFFLGIPFFLFCASISTLMIFNDSYYAKNTSYYSDAFLWWLLLLTPAIWMYYRAKIRRKKIWKIVEEVKNTGFYSPDKGYEGLSFTQGVYFGIDIKKGTMLYVRVYPGNIMEAIGFDIHNFTRTVMDDKNLEIYTKYINMPVISVPAWCTHPKTAANTMHAMAERGGYDYPVNFPRLIQEKRKEWERIAGLPVAEVF